MAWAQGFDTPAAARKLRDAGMDRDQAEAVATVLRDGRDEVVTKPDLRAELAKLELRMALFAFGLASVAVAVLKLIL